MPLDQSLDLLTSSVSSLRGVIGVQALQVGLDDAEARPAYEVERVQACYALMGDQIIFALP